MALFRSKIANRALFGILGLLTLTVVIIYVMCPLLFFWFPGIMRSFIFVPDEELPQFMDYQHPEKVGFVGARNFYVTTPDGVKIGVWHILPSNLEAEARKLILEQRDSISAAQFYRDWLANATVFLYLHGSAGTRTSRHRLRVYKLLSSLNYHVVTFDYRGYGDSTGIPKNETDLVEDAKAVYSWIKDSVNSGNIFLWGHSLGTGVASHLSDSLVNGGEPITGIILESPFDNMANAVRASALARWISFVPWFDFCFIRPLEDNDMAFSSDKHLRNIATPVLILHAKDDRVIPYNQAERLYDTVAASRKDPSSIRLIGYDASLGYGHYNIPRDPNLSTTVRDFVDKSIH